MRKGDDRPRESSPKQAGTSAPKLSCQTCRYVFPENKEGKQVGWKKRKADAAVVCREEKECRARALAIHLGIELGQVKGKEASWFWCRDPRDRIFKRLDVRPKNWKLIGWLPRYPLEERILACILYHSWCYPVSVEYAVQLAGTCPRAGWLEADDDAIITDAYKNPVYPHYVPLRETDIAHILNEYLSNVSRAFRRLIATKDVRVDQDRIISPAAKLVDLSIAERRAIYAQDSLTDEELKGVPVRFRRLLSLIQEQCPEDISSDIFAKIGKLCTTFNDKLRDIRTERDAGIHEECSRGSILIPAVPVARRSSSSRGSPRTPVKSVPASSGGKIDDDGATLKELYDADGGKGALAKLPAKEDRPAALIQARLRHWVAPMLVDEQSAADLWRDCQATKLGWTPAEVCALIDEKGAMAQTKPRPLGFLLVAVGNLHKDAAVLAQIRQQQQAAKSKERDDEAWSIQRDAAVAKEAAQIERREAAWMALPESEREARVARHLKRLAAEASTHPETRKVWGRMNPIARKSNADIEARRELSTELESELGAGGGE